MLFEFPKREDFFEKIFPFWKQKKCHIANREQSSEVEQELSPWLTLLSQRHHGRVVVSDLSYFTYRQAFSRISLSGYEYAMKVKLFTSLALLALMSRPAATLAHKQSDDPLPLKAAITLPLSTEALSLDILNCDFRLTHEQRDDIEVRVNYPKHWSVNDKGVVKQLNVARCPTGIYHTQNGHNLIGSGTIPAKCSINITGDGVFLNGKKLPVERKATKPGAIGTEFTSEGIFINGHRLIAGNTDAGSDSELDVLQVVVPSNYQGSLTVRSKGSLPASIDFWSAATIKVLAAGKGELTIDSINSTSSASSNNSSNCQCELSCENSGKIVVNNLNSNDLKAKATAQSSINIKNANCSTAALYVANDGVASVGSGSIEKCETTASDKSSVSLKMKARSVTINADGASKISIADGAVNYLKITRSQDAKVNVASEIGCLEEFSGDHAGLIYTNPLFKSTFVQK